ncbi:hypothetical protein AALO_G00183580 [Alosa alosa]|uniref:Uncharacterized protein n=1 Tax=Alosa alosa TaxID=278164 RepID=A0AAV6GB30_9TELE|nr:hypothetical protein AALO_G00183580 [Alosa alosa]
MLAHTLLVLSALVLAYGAPQDKGDTDTLTRLQAQVEELKDRLTIAEKELKEVKDVPKVLCITGWKWTG